MPYDAGHYWELAVKFQRHHHSFSLLYFNDNTRGYLSALIQFPALIVRFLTHCSMPSAAKVLGLGWATLLFAILIPALWRSLSNQRVSGGRWLLLLLLAAIFWRDHFSFTATDVPGISLLLLAMWSVSRPSLGWWLLGGLSLAATVDVRPMYLGAVLPALLLAGWWNNRHGPHGWRRWVALLMGAVVALGPQLAINRLYYNTNSPLALARASDIEETPLYLKQLTWGTRVLRYDTDVHQRLVYADSTGLAVLRQEGIADYTSYRQFLGVALRHPINYTWRYVRHLFNGLDVQQPAPYLIRPYGPERPWVQLFNYSSLGLGLSVLLVSRPTRWLRWPRNWVLLALLLPCAVAVPTAIECRFLLPLHLLLLTMACFQFPFQLGLNMLRSRPVRILPAMLLAAWWLGGCFWLSAATTRNLVPDHGKSLVD